ncbi:hypothetical protein ACWDTD_10120 [Gordonia sp. NPDC003425]
MKFLAPAPHAMFRGELIDAGYADHEIRSAVRTGLLTALGHGVVIDSALLDGTPEQRHRELSLAYGRRLPPGRALADASAAAVLQLPVWGLDTSRVTMAVSGAQTRSKSSGATRIITDRRPESTVVVDGVPVVSPARVVIDIARREPREPAVVVGDAALHLGLCSVADLANELDLIGGMTGAARARRVVAELDAASESVFESRSRILFADVGLPAPELQVELFDLLGNFIARVDFCWRERRVVGQADGMSKYDDGQGRKERLLSEKEQDDALLEAGHRPIHWYWKDLEHERRRGRLIARLTSMLAEPTAA